MSFDPRLIIDYDELHAQTSAITAGIYNKRFKQATKNAYEIIENALGIGPITFKGVRFIIIHPELSAVNKKVREVLELLGVNVVIDWESC